MKLASDLLTVIIVDAGRRKSKEWYIDPLSFNYKDN